MTSEERLACFYLTVKRLIENRGYAMELAWHEHVPRRDHTEHDVLAEATWAILSVGMADRVVRQVHQRVMVRLDGLPSAAHLVDDRVRLETAALEVFRHRGKVDAIFGFAAYLRRIGTEELVRRLHQNPVEALAGLRFFGPASSLHLAKNLGVRVAKPDRHLVRLSGLTGHTPQELCDRLAGLSNDDVHVIDYVLWRYLSLDRRFLSLARCFLCPEAVPASPQPQPKPALPAQRQAPSRPHQTQTSCS